MTITVTAASSVPASTFINRALRTAGVLGNGETADADMLQTSLDALNDMLDSWSAARMYIYHIAQSSRAATVGTGVYTIGAGGDFNITRPTVITDVTYTVGTLDYTLRPLTRDEYSAIPIKTQGGIPEYYWYEPSFPLGTLRLWQAPSLAGTISIQSPQQLTQFTDQATAIAFPPGYREAIHLGLAVKLCNEFNLASPQQLKLAETQAKRRIRRLNAEIPVLSLPADVMGGRGYGADGGF